MRIVQRLIGDEAVDLRGLDPGIVEARLDAFEMKRMRARLRPLPDFSFTDANDGVAAADFTHGCPHKNGQRLWIKKVLKIPALHDFIL